MSRPSVPAWTKTDCIFRDRNAMRHFLLGMRLMKYIETCFLRLIRINHIKIDLCVTWEMCSSIYLVPIGFLYSNNISFVHGYLFKKQVGGDTRSVDVAH